DGDQHQRHSEPDRQAAGLALRAVPSLVPVLAGSLAVGLGVPLVLVTVWSAMQRETPGLLIGRVSATVNMLTFGPGTLAIAAGASLLALVNHRVILLVAAVTAVALAGWALLGGDRTTPPAEPSPDHAPAPATPGGRG
ncbi:hypothetical protein DLE60_23950, partial [Micromonospora globispora]